MKNWISDHASLGVMIALIYALVRMLDGDSWAWFAIGGLCVYITCEWGKEE